MKIMISAANADVCLSMARIIKSDAQWKDALLIGLSPDDPWPASLYFDEILQIPMANDRGYGEALAKAIDQTKPDFFLPFSEAELLWFVNNPNSLKTLKTKIIINPSEILAIFLDKKTTADFLEKHGLSVPRTMQPHDVQVRDLPVIIKPRQGAGSKKIVILRNALQLAGFLEEHDTTAHSFVAQELIDTPDAEFTCGVWRCGGQLRYCILRRRLQGGMTGFARVERDSAIEQAIEKVAASLAGDFFINIQLRLHDGIPYIFEINPRFSSTVMMRHKIGFRDFLWTLNWLKSGDLPPAWHSPEDTRIFRISDECVVQGDELYKGY